MMCFPSEQARHASGPQSLVHLDLPLAIDSRFTPIAVDHLSEEQVIAVAGHLSVGHWAVFRLEPA